MEFGGSQVTPDFWLFRPNWRESAMLRKLTEQDLELLAADARFVTRALTTRMGELPRLIKSYEEHDENGELAVKALVAVAWRRSNPF